MIERMRIALSVLILVSALAGWPPLVAAQPAAAPHFPPAGAWERKTLADVGMDPVKRADAVRFAEGRESTRAMDFSDQERISARCRDRCQRGARPPTAW